MAPLKVLINGGGIAGNALALCLSRQGHQVTILERFPSLRVSGLQIDLRGHGIEVMRRMGLEDKFRAKTVSEQGLQVVDSSGRRRAHFPANKSGKGLQSFTTDYEIMRGDLCRLLLDETSPPPHYIFGTSVDSIRESDGSVNVRMTNGENGQYDLVVGADGVGSRVRKLMLGTKNFNGFRPIKDSYGAYFTVPWAGDEYTATVFMTAGGRVVMTRRHVPDSLQVYLMCKSESEKLKNSRPGDVDAEKAAFREIFSGAGWETEKLLEAMTGADDFYCERMGLVKLDSWSQGRVALLGDAAYCPSANTGMGTTSAIVGAYILAGEIGKHCGGAEAGEGNTEESIQRALRAYEQKFRPFMTQVQEGVLEGSQGWSMPTSSLGVGLLNLAFSVASLLRLNIFGSMILKEKIKDWSLPEYDGMGK